MTDIEILATEVDLLTPDAAALARMNRGAALTAADWAWRHQRPASSLLEVLDELGIRLADLRPAPASSEVITLP
jgi:hypothetical protein